LVSCGTGWSAKVLHRRSDIVAAVATPRPLALFVWIAERFGPNLSIVFSLFTMVVSVESGSIC